ncbi:MAG: hypothetical protein WDM81_19220 [Rhizomicrobium sp.]
MSATDLSGEAGDAGNSEARIASLVRPYLAFFFVVLMGYQILGRGFAYIGFMPVYIGEVCLIAGLVVTLQTGLLKVVMADRTMIAVAVYMTWGAIRTVPGVPEHGLLALRDGVLWGYGLFAFTTASCLLADVEMPVRLLRWFRNFAIVFIVTTPIVFVVTQFFLASIPQWPGTEVPLISPDPGGLLVNFAAIVAFLLGGVITLPTYFVAALTSLVVIAAARARSGAVGFLAAMVLLGALTPIRKYLFWRCDWDCHRVRRLVGG